MKRMSFLILTGLGLLLGCTGQQSTLHDHDHDEVKLMTWSYCQDFEIFAEADPFVAGQTSEVLVHITHLSDFKPLTQGKVTVSIISGTTGIRQTAEAALRPGVFRLYLQPPDTGRASIQFEVEHEGSTFRQDGGEVYIHNDVHAALHAAEHLLVTHPTEVSFSKELSWVVDFQTIPVGKSSLGVIIRTVGQVLPAQGDEITLSAQTNGIINFEKPSLYEGTAINNGEVFISISGEGLAEGNAAQRYGMARNNLQRATADYERLTSLSESRIISQSQLLEARNEYENALAVFENLSEHFSETGQQIKSPVRGYVSGLYVSPGQYVEAGEPIIKIARNQDMVIKAEVQARHAHLLPGLATANIRGRDMHTYTLEELEGQIVSHARNVNSQSHLLPVYLQVNNLPGWVAGTLLNVYLKTSDTQQSIVVPNTSLIEEQGNLFVYVQLHPESFEKREVKTGNTDGISTQVLAGLSEGERIVSRGALHIKMASASGDVDPHSGHVH